MRTRGNACMTASRGRQQARTGLPGLLAGLMLLGLTASPPNATARSLRGRGDLDLPQLPNPVPIRAACVAEDTPYDSDFSPLFSGTAPAGFAISITQNGNPYCSLVIPGPVYGLSRFDIGLNGSKGMVNNTCPIDSLLPCDNTYALTVSALWEPYARCSGTVEQSLVCQWGKTLHNRLPGFVLSCLRLPCP
jgi:hypothetical protein